MDKGWHVGGNLREDDLVPLAICKIRVEEGGLGDNKQLELLDSYDQGSQAGRCA